MDVAGVLSVLIYDQTCAAEKRRRRKRGEYPDPNRRVLINELVCEGCGDCGVKSNCVAIQPVETPFGRKRQIDQSVCNKDYSCLKGFCPSFVTVEGGELIRGLQNIKLPGDTTLFPVLPEPELPPLGAPMVDPRHRHRRHRRRDGRSYTRHGCPSRGQGLGHHRHGRAVAEERRCRNPSQAGPPAGGHRRHPHRCRWRRSHPRLRSGHQRPPSACSPPPAEPAPRQSSTRTRPCRRSSPAIPISRFPADEMGLQIAGAEPARRHHIRRRHARLRPRCLAIPSPPISSPSALPISRAWCRWRAEAIEKAIRAQWRIGQDEPRGLPLGKARGA